MASRDHFRSVRAGSVVCAPVLMAADPGIAATRREAGNASSR